MMFQAASAVGRDEQKSYAAKEGSLSTSFTLHKYETQNQHERVSTIKKVDLSNIHDEKSGQYVSSTVSKYNDIQVTTNLKKHLKTNLTFQGFPKSKNQCS